MSKEGYVSAMRSRMEEISARTRQATIADEIATRIVKKYAYYNDGEEHSPLQTLEAHWDDASPNEFVYMELYDESGDPIPGSKNSDAENAVYLVKRADFIFGPGDALFGSIFSVSVNNISGPPYVTGLEDERLEAPEIEQVIVDLNRYEQALGAQRQ
jgi:hypothetical protein